MTCLSVANALIVCSALLLRGLAVSRSPRPRSLLDEGQVDLDRDLVGNPEDQELRHLHPVVCESRRHLRPTLMLSDVNPNRFWASTCSGVSLI